MKLEEVSDMVEEQAELWVGFIICQTKANKHIKYSYAIINM